MLFLSATPGEISYFCATLAVVSFCFFVVPLDTFVGKVKLKVTTKKPWLTFALVEFFSYVCLISAVYWLLYVIKYDQHIIIPIIHILCSLINFMGRHAEVSKADLNFLFVIIIALKIVMDAFVMLYGTLHFDYLAALFWFDFTGWLALLILRIWLVSILYSDNSAPFSLRFNSRAAGYSRIEQNDLEDVKSYPFRDQSVVFDASVSNESNKCGMYTATLFSLLFFNWVWPLLVLGYKNKSLSVSDLGHLKDKDLPINNFVDLIKCLQSVSQKKASRSLFLLLLGLHWKIVAGSAVYLMVSMSAGITSLLLLQQLLETFDNDAQNVTLGYEIAGALFFAKLVESASVHQFWIVGTQACMRMQGALVSTTCYKTLRLSPRSSVEYGIGDVTTLITVRLFFLFPLVPL